MLGSRLASPFTNLQRLSRAWDLVGESPSESVRKATTIELRACWIRDHPNARNDHATGVMRQSGTPRHEVMHDEGYHQPYANCRYRRVKQRNGLRPYERKDEFQYLSITCTCRYDHCPLVVAFDIKGNPKGGVIEGSYDCWYNLFKFATSHLRAEPKRRFLQHWNLRQKKFGKKNMSDKLIGKALQDYGKYSRDVLPISIIIAFCVRLTLAFQCRA